MPRRKQVAKRKLEEEEEPEKEEEEEEKPTPKRRLPPRKAKAPPQKRTRKAKEEAEEEEEEDEKDLKTKEKGKEKVNEQDEGEEEEEEGEQEEGDKQWEEKAISNGPATLFVLVDSRLKGSSKIAAFDMDDTLIRPKSKAKFPKSRADWQWCGEYIPKKLKSLYEDGFKIVIFTNQAGISKGHTRKADIKGKIEDLSTRLQIPLQAFIASADDGWRKPSSRMWDLFVREYNGGVEVDREVSFYCGDAAGRPKAWDGNSKTKKDFSCSDRKFARNIGLPFVTPEQLFLGEKREAPFDWDGIDPSTIPKDLELCTGDKAITSKDQELILFVGFPASGKSTFAKRYLVPNGYVHINQDTLKTKQKCFKAVEEALAAGKSVVVDNTNPGPDIREEYIEIAKEKGVPVRCFWFQTPLELAKHLNMYRELITNGDHEHVSRIAYAVYKKNFKEPKTSEGFTEVKKINFVPHFENKEAEHQFYQFT
jgi:bifunctional polynucleotide phosphatase/kinase